MKMANDSIEGKIQRGIFTGVLILLLIVVLFGTFYTIQSGSEGVLLTFGKAEASSKGAGLHMKVPIVQSVVKFDVRTQKYEAHAAAASNDLQDVSTNVAVNYHLSSGATPTVFTELGLNYGDRVIQPTVQEVVKAATAKFTAEELITKREEVKQDILLLLKERLDKRSIIIEDIAITNFEFSPSFTTAIEAKVTAAQAALEQKNRLEQFKYEADQVRTKAEGERDAAIAQATGEAQKVKLVQEQLAQSPQYIEYIKAQRWDGKLPSFYMAGSDAPTLLMSVPQLSDQK